MLLADLGLGLVLTVLAIFMIWKLADLLKRKGRWSEQLAEARSSGEIPPPELEPVPLTPSIEGQEAPR
jgi:hypothetical protein